MVTELQAAIMEQLVAKAAKASSKGPFESNWDINAEEIRIVKSPSITEIVVSIAASKNVWLWE